MAKSRKKQCEEKPQYKNVFHSALAKLISKINFNTLVTSICGLVISMLMYCNHADTKTTIETKADHQDSVNVKQNTWRAKRDSADKAMINELKEIKRELRRLKK